MTFIDCIESLSTRFLSERTHDLIVAPAIADLQYDSRDTEAGLRARPATYYTFLLILVVPEVTVLAGRWGPFLLASGLGVLSFAPVLVCCWPERTPRSQRPDVADA